MRSIKIIQISLQMKKVKKDIKEVYRQFGQLWKEKVHNKVINSI